MVGLRRGRATVVRRNPGDHSRTGRGGRRPLRALIEFRFPKHASPPRHTHPQDESYMDGPVTSRNAALWQGPHRHLEPTPGPGLPQPRAKGALINITLIGARPPGCRPSAHHACAPVHGGLAMLGWARLTRRRTWSFGF